MCTLTLAWQTFADAPVVVAANRDEALDRPSLSPAVREDDPVVFAPLDERAGGTWMGVNDRGLFVGITNRWVEGVGGERSRGLLVRDCLRTDSAAEAARLVERAVREHDHDGFNLVAADAGPTWGEHDDPAAAILLEWDGHLRVRTFEPGVHVVVNVGADGAFYEPPGRPDLGAEQANDASRLREHLRPEPGESAPGWVGRAAETVADHEFGVCVHEDGYGTVSSSLVRLNSDRTLTYEFAAGPPCETPYEVVHDGPLVADAAPDDAEGRL